jgi:hypothetical protein
MTPEEAKRREMEQLEEADGWVLLAQQFFDQDFDRMICPHCQGTSFEYMIHQKMSFTLRCQACGRFTHARAAAPLWTKEYEHPPGRYAPLPPRKPGPNT